MAEFSRDDIDQLHHLYRINLINSLVKGNAVSRIVFEAVTVGERAGIGKCSCTQQQKQ